MMGVDGRSVHPLVGCWVAAGGSSARKFADAGHFLAPPRLRPKRGRRRFHHALESVITILLIRNCHFILESFTNHLAVSSIAAAQVTRALDPARLSPRCCSSNILSVTEKRTGRSNKYDRAQATSDKHSANERWAVVPRWFEEETDRPGPLPVANGVRQVMPGATCVGKVVLNRAKVTVGSHAVGILSISAFYTSSSSSSASSWAVPNEQH